MPADMVRNVVIGMSRCPALQNLALRGGTLCAVCMQAAAAELAKCTGLVSLDLSSNGLTAATATELAPRMLQLTALRSLDIHGNRVGYEAAMMIVNAVSQVAAPRPYQSVVLIMWDCMPAAQLSAMNGMSFTKNLHLVLSYEQAKHYSGP